MRLLTLALVLTCLLSSCKKDGIPNSTPDCIVDLIDELKKDVTAQPKSEVYRYRYNGETVYLVTARCCDLFSTVYDKDCNIICQPDGGITGDGDGGCTDFFEEASKKKLIWNELQD